MQLKYKIIWKKISQIVRFWNCINFSETSYLCRCVYLYWLLPNRLSGGGSRIHWLHLSRVLRRPNGCPGGPVGLGRRIHRLHLCRRVWLLNECSGYDTKQSDVEVPVMLELWGMRSTPSLPSLPGPLWPDVVTLDQVLYMVQIKLNCILMLNWIVWNRTVLILKLRTEAKLNCLK